MKKIKSSTLLILIAALSIAIITYGFLDFNGDNTSSPPNKKPDNIASNASKIESNSNVNTASVSSEENLKKEVTTTDKKIQNGLHKVEFGFNIGFLSDFQTNQQAYRKALNQIQNDGINNLRIYELFTKNITQQPGLAAKLVDKLVDDHHFNLLLCLSNFPDIPGIQYKTSGISDFKDADVKQNFTNRYPPVNFDAYQNYLTNFLNTLQEKNDLNNISFEIGNEPDSKRFFWGTPDDFAIIARSTANVLESYKRPIYCCGFTADFADGSAAEHQGYLNLIKDQNFRDNVNLSFHFYQSNKFEINKIQLPALKNSIITEFNFYGSMKQGSSRLDVTNSPVFGSLLIQALDFAYKNEIAKIYLFKLIDVANKEGLLGFFDVNGNPKPSYNAFIKVYNVIKDGYRVEENASQIKLVGLNQTIVYSKTNGVNTNELLHENNGFGKQKNNKNFGNNGSNFFMGNWNVVNN
ncbi:MAG: hypothetical protein JST21_09295 [Bacteroidetes bacterium]|nr:hypothetical protein [Bacteroidota bacterium]